MQGPAWFVHFSLHQVQSPMFSRHFAISDDESADTSSALQGFSFFRTLYAKDKPYVQTLFYLR